VIRETENPFDDDDDEELKSPTTATSGKGQSSKAQLPYGQTSGTVQSFTHARSSSASGSGSFFGSSKDKKKKDKKPKRLNPFNLEQEKEQMKSTIAESYIAATDLMNALKSINRERERISENQTAAERFEICKQLRRRILRYVSLSRQCERVWITDDVRSTMWRVSSGSAVYFTPMTS
jgi:hypothetical protein